MTATAGLRRRAVLTMTLTAAASVAVAAIGPAGAAPSPTAGAQPATVSSTASGAGAPAGGAQVALNLPTTPGVARPKQVQPAVVDTCTQPRPAGTGTSKRVACLTTNPDAARAQTAAGVVTPNTVVGANCTLVKSQWEIDRTTACIQRMGFTAEIREEPGGPIVGMEHFSINQNIILNTNSPGFVENDTIVRDTPVQKNYIPSDRLDINFFARCDAPCQTNNPSLTIFLPSAVTSPSSQDFSISYFGNPASGQANTFNTHYSFSTVDLDEGWVSDTVSWGSPESIRCDDKLRPRGPGCVFGFWGPLLNLPVSLYGAAAVNVAVGQSKLAQPFGTQILPLTRGNTSVSDPNRDAICDDGSFFPSLLLVSNDSCDEYPFASTQQSGAQRGFTGNACMEIMALGKSNGEWAIWLMHGVQGAHPCLRGHVNKDQNIAVGRAVQLMYTNYRMLTGDPYAVEVDN